jgi:hypothetical protein
MSNDEITLWQKFIEELARLCEQGIKESEISSRFLGVCIEGSGVVLEIKLAERYAAGIALKMSPETVDLPKKNKILRCDYIFLSIDENTKRDWMACSVGQSVRFRAKIPGTNGPFSAIRFSEYDEEPEVLLMIKLRECRLVSNS